VAARTIVIAGAGIGGLTAALALAAKGFHIVLIDQAERLTETGAGVQLSPNATRVLLQLGLGDRLAASTTRLEAIRVRKARTGGEIARIPLDKESRYGAPFWSLHRGDLQAGLLGAIEEHPDISLMLGAKVDDFAVYSGGITVQSTREGRSTQTQGIALVGADGLWSTLRARLGDERPPRFAKRVAWRAVVPAVDVPDEFREPVVQLWLASNAHLVHYPVKGGRVINIVAIARERHATLGWGNSATRFDVFDRFSRRSWARPARELLATPERWLKWALYDRPPLRHWGRGPVTLIGDAAHPMLPFLAQGAAMAIEDAATLAHCLDAGADIEPALRRYERERAGRTRKTQRAARRNGFIYHLAWPDSVLRDVAMRAMGGERLLSRYDWIYDWQVPAVQE
jgi:salicylate hydroxylase